MEGLILNSPEGYNIEIGREGPDDVETFNYIPGVVRSAVLSYVEV